MITRLLDVAARAVKDLLARATRCPRCGGDGTDDVHFYTGCPKDPPRTLAADPSDAIYVDPQGRGNA